VVSRDNEQNIRAPTAGILGVARDMADSSGKIRQLVDFFALQERKNESYCGTIMALRKLR
jgi:hypothetical protein